uniref:Uncharacterized protein n=1 Tax=Anguilla anguilla TaxID=7936 RepID=A0A0E9RJI7_ANGAN
MTSHKSDLAISTSFLDFATVLQNVLLYGYGLEGLDACFFLMCNCFPRTRCSWSGCLI